MTLSAETPIGAVAVGPSAESRQWLDGLADALIPADEVMPAASSTSFWPFVPTWRHRFHAAGPSLATAQANRRWTC